MDSHHTSVADLCAEVRGGRLFFDAILVLGGGRPSSPSAPPAFVASRCAAAAAVRTAHQEEVRPLILALSAGTPHSPQLLDNAGLPIWEATASAARLVDLGVPAAAVLVETVAYDTIGNAFFARVCHTDIAGWRRLLVVTSEFHVGRTRAVFDWVFGVDPQSPPYELSYLATANAGLSAPALAARQEHEAKGARNVQEVLVPTYTTLRDVHSFLAVDHGCHCAAKLVERSTCDPIKRDDDDEALSQSYGCSALGEIRSPRIGEIHGPRIREIHSPRKQAPHVCFIISAVALGIATFCAGRMAGLREGGR